MILSLLVPNWIPNQTKGDEYIEIENKTATQSVYYRPSEETIEAATAVYIKSLPKPKVQKKNLVKSTGSNTSISRSGACSCVIWAQKNGLSISGYGLARNYPVNSKIPAATGFVVTYESSSGHIAKYTLSGQYLILDEANYKRCTVTHGRIILVGSKIIKGYIN